MLSLTQLNKFSENKQLLHEWLLNNSDTVLTELYEVHNKDMELALLHGLLTDNLPDSIKVQKAISFLQQR